ncbi:uncharacterized protein LOC128256661 [Drosophila gunungcola]|uniref:uncharacterized protein LOC128256661 n=1 Tax=Drosophila gunungcola TaxID=103775 RepID=UPI0022E6B99D|nr:uncharacterized protein LOC128256661 [Drosophila gunungcola]
MGSKSEKAAMGSRFYMRNFILFGLLASSYLQIPVGEMEANLDREISVLFKILQKLQTIYGLDRAITFTGNVELRPSLEQRAMDTISLPLYSVRFELGVLNQRYPSDNYVVIVIFTGLDDPSLAAVKDKALQNTEVFFVFLYTSPRNEKLTIITTVLIVRNNTNIEQWSYFYLRNINIVRLDVGEPFLSVMRKNSYKFSVQVVNDPPSVFWYNSSDQAAVTGGGNISLSGCIGLMIVEFIRYLNATFYILPVSGQQTSQYEVIQLPGNQSVDVVANMVDNDSLKSFSPMVTDSQICVVVPNHRLLAPYRYIDKNVNIRTYPIISLSILGVFFIKYFAHRRRSLLDPIFSSFRFHLAIPLPGGQLDRLPLADKLVEVFSFFFLGLLVGATVSVMSTAFTTGMWEPQITNVETMRASGLKILTADPTILQVFKDNILPSSLADLVTVVDMRTKFRYMTGLNHNFAYVVKTHNWKALRLYQQHIKTEPFQIAGKELCSRVRAIRIPISPKSPLRFLYLSYFSTVFESGLLQKWDQMGFKKYRELNSLFKLPSDVKNHFRPLSVDYFLVFIWLYMGGMFVSTLVFAIELLINKYRHK